MRKYLFLAITIFYSYIAIAQISDSLGGVRLGQTYDECIQSFGKTDAIVIKSWNHNSFFVKSDYMIYKLHNPIRLFDNNWPTVSIEFDDRKVAIIRLETYLSSDTDLFKEIENHYIQYDNIYEKLDKLFSLSANGKVWGTKHDIEKYTREISCSDKKHTLKYIYTRKYQPNGKIGGILIIELSNYYKSETFVDSFKDPYEPAVDDNQDNLSFDYDL